MYVYICIVQGGQNCSLVYCSSNICSDSFLYTLILIKLFLHKSFCLSFVSRNKNSHKNIVPVDRPISFLTFFVMIQLKWKAILITDVFASSEKGKLYLENAVYVDSLTAYSWVMHIYLNNTLKKTMFGKASESRRTSFCKKQNYRIRKLVPFTDLISYF